MKPYGYFCPISKAVEIFAQRWTPLILRELLAGSRRFNELERGLSNIPRSLLVQRLRALEDVGIIEREVDERGRTVEYRLLPPGQDLLKVVMTLGEWGQHWVVQDIGPADVDPDLLMWDMHRRINVERLPPDRVVVQFDFYGARNGAYWLVLERPDPSVCLHHPGLEIDMFVTADTLALHRVWMGRMSIGDAMRRGELTVDGPTILVRAFPSWLALNVFAGMSPMRSAL